MQSLARPQAGVAEPALAADRCRGVPEVPLSTPAPHKQRAAFGARSASFADVETLLSGIRTTYALASVSIFGLGCGSPQPIHTTPPPPDPPATESAADLCTTAEADAAEVLSEADATADALEYEGMRSDWIRTTAPLRSCLAAGRGAWMLLPSAVSADFVQGADMWGEESEGFVWQVTWRLTYLAPDGGRHPGDEDRTIEADPMQGYRTFVDVMSVADLDADGIGELVLARHVEGHENSSTSFAFWSVVNGAVGAYAPAADIDLARVVDYDEDGRMDIESWTNYWSQVEPGMVSDDVGMPAVLFHSRPDGSFSPSDDVAARFLRGVCPSRPDRFFDTSGRDWQFDAFTLIACARLWGQPRAETEEQVRREWDALPDLPEHQQPIYELRDYLGHAAVEPPLQLE